MIKIMIGTTTSTKDVLLPSNTKIKDALLDNGIDISVGRVHLDALPLTPEELDKTFADFNITESCMLILILKSDGGNI